MRKLLWIGDAVVSSGFARATHKILDEFRKSWSVTVLGINYPGDPHPYPYPIYPAMANYSDPWGLRRTAELVTMIKPDVVVVQNDPWNIPRYVDAIGNVPTIAIAAVDGLNCKGRGMNGCLSVIFWTEFAAKEAALGGYKGPFSVIPLGVDLDIYKPQDRTMARQWMNLPGRLKDAFIVGNVNRNQPRKRLDLTIQYFAEWVKSKGVTDAYLYLHIAPTGDKGWDAQQLMRYYGLSSRLILAEPELGYGCSEADLAYTYSAFDVMMTTTQGEGWGLPTLEGMACGIPQICPDWSALGEWASTAALMVPCTSHAVTPEFINVIGGIADKERFILALDALYNDQNNREYLSDLGLKLANQEQYRWSNIGKAYVHSVEEAVNNIPTRAEVAG